METFLERLLTTIVLEKPDMLFTVNHLGFDEAGVLTGILSEIELPYVSWFVDSPPFILVDHKANASSYAITPIWERAYDNYLREFGFAHIFHLPLAGDPSVFQRTNLSNSIDFPLSFVGDSMEYACNKWSDRFPPFSGSERLIETLIEHFNVNRKMDFGVFCKRVSETVNISIPLMLKRNWISFYSYIVIKTTMRQRMKMLMSVPPEQLHVFGDFGWRHKMPLGSAYHEPVDYYNGLNKVYKGTCINLNNTSMQMPTAVNQRVFDIPLSGGFLLTDNQEDLRILFDKNEIAVYSNEEDLKDKVNYYSQNQNTRKRISDSAMKSIRDRHTYVHRIARLISYARNEFGMRRYISAMSILEN